MEMQEVVVQKQGLLVFRNLQGTEKGNLRSCQKRIPTTEREAEYQTPEGMHKENMTGSRSKDAWIRLERQS